jgi:hypothetical protein
MSRTHFASRFWLTLCLAGIGILLAMIPAKRSYAQAVTVPPVVTRIETELKSAPDTVGRILQRLPAQTRLTQLPGRFGPWIQVRTAQGTVGWIQRLDVSGARHVEAPALTTAAPPTTSPNALSLNGTPLGTPVDPSAASRDRVGSRLSTTLLSSMPAAAPEPVVQQPGVVEQRLEQLLTYRADSEAARKFAFMASLELVKLPKALSAASLTGAVVPTETATTLGPVPDTKVTP